MNKRYERKHEQWEIAKEYLHKHGVKLIDDNKIIYSGHFSNVILTSKQLENCIKIKYENTNEDIINMCNMQLKIAGII